MAVTVSRYNHTALLIGNKSIDWSNLKYELLNNTATFNAANTTRAQVDNTGGYEVYGNGWPQGGVVFAAPAWTTVDISNAMYDVDDIAVTAIGGPIGPAWKALIYDATSGKPLWFVDFGRSQDAGETTQFRVAINTAGLLRLVNS